MSKEERKPQTNSKMVNAPYQRSLASPLQNPDSNSRKPSVVELLSSPPPLPNTPEHDDVHAFSLSRNTSLSSRSSLFNPTAVGRSPSATGVDWADIPLADLTESNKLIAIHSGYSVQKAFETLATHDLTSVPVALSKTDTGDLLDCLTFDYSDLNTYLLLIMNKINATDLNVDELGSPEDSLEQKQQLVQDTINGAKRGEEVSVDFIVKLHPKNEFVKFSENDVLCRVMEVLGNGVHRVAITDLTGEKITGILSQRRLIKYMWDNARRFPSLEFYLNSTLQDLQIGSNSPIFIYEDQLLIEALYKMFVERVTSLAVVDRSKILMGNISVVDVKNVTWSLNSHYLFKPVLQFISYNLTQKGMEEGQDQFPIFHANNQSSLGRVIAKLVATQAHRLWIVESRSHMPSTSSASSGNSVHNSVASPVLGSANSFYQQLQLQPGSASAGQNSVPSSAASSGPPPSAMSPRSPSTVEAVLSQPPIMNTAPALTPEQVGMPGKLIGVVTLTDILGLFASTRSNKKIDPQHARNQRRRSSTSTTRSSMEVPANSDIFRKSYTSSKSSNVFSKDA